MPSIIIKDTEHFDIGLRKFKRACEKAAIVPEIRAREFYEKPTEKRKRLMAAAVKRAKKPTENFHSQDKDLDSFGSFIRYQKRP